MAFYDENRHSFIPGTFSTTRNGVTTPDRPSVPAIEWKGTTLKDALEVIGQLWEGEVCVGDLEWRLPDPTLDGVPRGVPIRRDLTTTWTPTYPTFAYYHVYIGEGKLIGLLALPDRTEPPEDVRQRWESIVAEVLADREARGGKDRPMTLSEMTGAMPYRIDNNPESSK